MSDQGGAPEGNTNALVHGAKTKPLVDMQAGNIVDEWLNPETGLALTTQVDRAAIMAVASAYAQLTTLAIYFNARDPLTGTPRGMIDSRGRPRGAARLYLEAFKSVMAGLAALGATPASRAGMAGSIAALKGRADAEAAQARLRARLHLPAEESA